MTTTRELGHNLRLVLVAVGLSLTLTGCLSMESARGDRTANGEHFRFAVGASNGALTALKLGVLEYCNDDETDCVLASRGNAAGAGYLNVLATPAIEGAAMIGAAAALRPARSTTNVNSGNTDSGNTGPVTGVAPGGVTSTGGAAQGGTGTGGTAQGGTAQGGTSNSTIAPGAVNAQGGSNTFAPGSVQGGQGGQGGRGGQGGSSTIERGAVVANGGQGGSSTIERGAVSVQGGNTTFAPGAVQGGSATARTGPVSLQSNQATRVGVGVDVRQGGQVQVQGQAQSQAQQQIQRQ